MSFPANPSCQNVLQLSKKNQGLEKEFESVSFIKLYNKANASANASSA